MDAEEAAGSDDVQLVADDRGLAVFGSEGAVERFLAHEGLTTNSPAAAGLGIGRLRNIVQATALATEGTAQVAAKSGRWVKLTQESAQTIQKYGLRQSSKSGLATGVVKGEKGQIKGFVEFAQGPGAKLANPANLAGAAAVMSQLAMQQTMDEITDYLKRIDAKLDEVLRAQKDGLVSRLLGAGMAVDEAVTVSRARGKVDAVTWSKVQNLSTTIAEVQGYALAQLVGVADKLEAAERVGEMAEATTEAVARTHEWLAVLARTFQVQEGLDVLELDRVLDASPDEIDDHRRGLEEARRNRLRDIGAATERLLRRIQAVAGVANAKVLLHPSASPRAVRASTRAGTSIDEFHNLIGLDSGHEGADVRRWSSAAKEARDRAIETGSGGVRAARRSGGAAVTRVRDGADGARKSALALPARIRAGRDRAGDDGNQGTASDPGQ